MHDFVRSSQGGKSASLQKPFPSRALNIVQAREPSIDLLPPHAREELTAGTCLWKRHARSDEMHSVPEIVRRANVNVAILQFDEIHLPDVVVTVFPALLVRRKVPVSKPCRHGNCLAKRIWQMIA